MASSAGGAGGRQIALVLLTLGAACAEVEWADSQVLTDTWKAVSGGDFNTLLALTVSAKEGFAAQRSADGRGPMWWAYEFKNPSALALFKHFGVSDAQADGGGLRPADTFDGSAAELALLQADAEQRVPGIPSMLQQFEARLEEMMAQQAARFDEGAPAGEGEGGEGEGGGAGGELDDDELDDELEDGEDEDEAPAEAPSDDIAAKVAALMKKAQAIKDEV